MNSASSLFSSFLLIMILSACTGGNDKAASPAIQVININTNSIDSTGFDDIFSAVKVIPLQSDSQALISELRKVFVNDSLIIIPDLKKETVNIFGYDGLLKRQIRSFDAGRVQFQHMTDVFYDRVTNLIQVWSLNNSTITNFNCQGKLVNTVRLNNYEKTGYFFAANSGHYYFDRFNSNLDGNHLGIYSKLKNDFVKSLVKIQPILVDKVIINYNNLDEHNDLIYYVPFLNDTIYVIENDRLKNEFVIKIDGGMFFPEEAKKNIHDTTDLLEIASKNKFISNIEQLYAFEDGIFFSFFGPKRCNVFYRTKENKAVCFADKLVTSDKKTIVIDYVASKYKNSLVAISSNRRDMVIGKHLKDTLTAPQNPSIVILDLVPF